ncbi:response regulator transcription factor [Paenibacillus lignilyticus]|uniref:Response regulator n=1 Tax=Paenibacillus lignilyticus TaxID=1172615 RepID=A0ABS5CL55_9BACL|nr:response regulator [Paenibacillus lignilyticus]MBP3966562.1 response regulator [Paenibacillus lignilyticus]
MIKLLVVEDETVTRKGLMKHIKWNELGVDVVEEAKDGVEGLEVARRMHPDIVVSDIRMPGMNGIEFTASLREEFPACKIIYMSGYSDKEYLKAAIRIHAVSYVEKPIVIEELQEVIRKAVHLCMENNKVNHINMALSSSLPFIRQNIVNDLINNHTDCDELRRNLNLAGISFNQGDSYTVSIIVPSYDDDETGVLKQSCCNRIIEFLHHTSHGFTHLAVMKDSTHMIVISAHKPESKQEFAAVYHLLSEHLKEQGMACSRLSWVVGGTSAEVSRIRDSYETAAGFLKHLFYYDFGNIFYAANREVSVFPIHAEILKSYAELLQELHKDKIIQFTEQLYTVIRTKTGTPVDEVKNLFYQMMHMLIEQAAKRGLDLSISDHRKEEYDWAMMSRIDTLKHLKGYFLKKAADLLDRIENIESSSRAVLDVIKYIRSNYSDKEISVNMLADHVHLTPTYLSSLFRKETGKTISEFITEVRIEKSANLLMKPQAKLYEIADRSGYNDANYFTKAFKKITGMTPTQFRRKHKS